MEEKTLKKTIKKLHDLELPATDKRILGFCATPRTIADVAALLGVRYTTASNYMRVLTAGGFLNKTVAGYNKGARIASRYQLNYEKVIL